MKMFLVGILASVMILEMNTLAVDKNEHDIIKSHLFQENISEMSEKSRNVDFSMCGENVRWSYSDGTLTLTGSGDMYDYSIMTVPFYHNEHRQDIERIVFEGNITRIGSCAFAEFINLKEIVIPETVKSIGDSVFFECINLTSITIPNSVTTIEDGAFMECYKFSEVYFNGSEGEWNDISKGSYNEYLLSATIHYENTNPQNSNFVDYEYEVTETNQVAITKYNGTATSLEIPSTIDGKVVTEIRASAFRECNSLESVTIPDGVVTLGAGALGDCSNLKKVIIPSSVKEIGLFHHVSVFGAFSGCDQLTSAGPIGSGADIEFAWTEEIPNCAFAQLVNLSRVILPDSITRIGEDSFSCNSDTNQVESIYIPRTMREIGQYALGQCENLSNIYFQGTESEWNAMDIAYLGIPEIVQVHYNAQQNISPTYSSWATSHIEKAEENLLIVDALGMNYTNDITRSQIAALLVNMVEKYTGNALIPADSTTFTDTTDTAILKANAAGIISGMGDGTFSPNSTATREQIAMMIYKTILVMEETTGTELVRKDTSLSGFQDSGDVSSWALEAVAILANNDIMKGTGEGNLSPLSTASIEQGIILNNALFAL